PAYILTAPLPDSIPPDSPVYSSPSRRGREEPQSAPDISQKFPVFLRCPLSLPAFHFHAEPDPPWSAGHTALLSIPAYLFPSFKRFCKIIILFPQEICQ